MYVYDDDDHDDDDDVGGDADLSPVFQSTAPPTPTARSPAT